MPGQLIPSAGGGSVSPEDVQGAVETALSAVLPSGGTTSQMMVKASDDDLDFTFADPINAVASVRVWEEAALLYSETFDSIGDEFVKSGTATTSATSSAMASFGGTGKPSFANGMEISSSGFTATANVSLDLSGLTELDGKQTTKITFWTGEYKGTNGNPNFYFLDGSTVRYTRLGTELTSSTMTWTQREFVLPEQTTVTWRLVNSGNATHRLVIAGLEVYGTPEPYGLNEVVIYQGSYYRSTQANNPHTPGSGQGWQEV